MRLFVVFLFLVDLRRFRAAIVSPLVVECDFPALRVVNVPPIGFIIVISFSIIQVKYYLFFKIALFGLIFDAPVCDF